MPPTLFLEKLVKEYKKNIKNGPRLDNYIPDPIYLGMFYDKQNNIDYQEISQYLKISKEWESELVKIAIGFEFEEQQLHRVLIGLNTPITKCSKDDLTYRTTTLKNYVDDCPKFGLKPNFRLFDTIVNI